MAQPKLPILIMAKPRYYLAELEERRIGVIQNSYLTAKEQGDENVYFLDSRKLLEVVGDNGLVDSVRPTIVVFQYGMCGRSGIRGNI